MRAVKRASTRDRAAARWLGADGTNVLRSTPVGRSVAGRRLAMVKTSRSGIGRSTGARVVSRLQKSVRSILSSPCTVRREANRNERGVARRGGSFLDEGSFIASGDKGAGASAKRP